MQEGGIELEDYIEIKDLKISFKSYDGQKRVVDIDELKIDGKKYGKNYLEHDKMIQGVRMDYRMSAQPNMKRGTMDSDIPYSFSLEKK